MRKTADGEFSAAQTRKIEPPRRQEKTLEELGGLGDLAVKKFLMWV